MYGSSVPRTSPEITEARRKLVFAETASRVSKTSSLNCTLPPRPAEWWATTWKAFEIFESHGVWVASGSSSAWLGPGSRVEAKICSASTMMGLGPLGLDLGLTSQISRDTSLLTLFQPSPIRTSDHTPETTLTDAFSLAMPHLLGKARPPGPQLCPSPAPPHQSKAAERCWWGCEDGGGQQRSLHR